MAADFLVHKNEKKRFNAQKEFRHLHKYFLD